MEKNDSVQMSTSTILKAENISKQYRLGTIGSGSLGDDLKRWWYQMRGKEDPFLKVGAVNDRSSIAHEDYVWALRNINFEVKQGEVLGIIGKNGAGKSTLLKILSKVTSPTTGIIRTRGRIASLLEVGTGFHPELTGRENIFMNGAVLGMTRREIKNKLEEIISFSGCEKYIDTPVKRYSSGMTVRLAFAVAAHLEPEILVIDEVLAVGDAEFQKKAIGKMQNLSRGEGRTVLFVSHNMVSVKNLCTKGLLLENGQITYFGTVNDTVEHYLTNTRSIPRKKAKITEKNRRSETTSQELHLKWITLEFPEISVRSEIGFRIKIKKNIFSTFKACITGTICTLNDVEVGSFFTETFLITEELSEIKILIPNHNLAVGEYYLNIAVSKGNIRTSDLTTIDHAYEAIGFEIYAEGGNEQYATRWNKAWGNLFFDSKIELL